jgi:hypothetical protein
MEHMNHYKPQQVYLALAVLGALWLAFVGCSRQQAHEWTGGLQKTETDAPEAANRANPDAADIAITEEPELKNSDNGKASDDDEGIPGYMQNIEAVAVGPATTPDGTDDDQWQLSAPAGTVTRGRDQVVINVWRLDDGDIDRDRQVIREGKAAEAEWVASTVVAGDGGFGMTVEATGLTDALVFSINDQEQPQALSFWVDQEQAFAGFWVEKDGLGDDDIRVGGLLASDMADWVDTMGQNRVEQIFSSFDIVFSN